MYALRIESLSRKEMGELDLELILLITISIDSGFNVFVNCYSRVGDSLINSLPNSYINNLLTR